MNDREAYEGAMQVLAANAYAVYSALLCGRPSPNQKLQEEWMATPRLGDMVYVDAARDADSAQIVGRWAATWTYIFPTDEDEDGDPDTPYSERGNYVVYDIELLDGTFFKWTDVKLLRIPANEKEWIRITIPERRWPPSTPR